MLYTSFGRTVFNLDVNNSNTPVAHLDISVPAEPLLEFIEWEETSKHNIEVMNNTLDYYRFFDATKHAEFLFDCVLETLTKIIPEEIKYLSHFDEYCNTPQK